MKMSKEKEIEVYADNGMYSHSEIINSETGEFICYVCPICGGRWEDQDSFFEHSCCMSDTYSKDDLIDWD